MTIGGIVESLIAFDRAMPAWEYDRDGRVRIATCNITKAGVSPYRGNELQDWQQLELEPQKTYYLFRSPAELKKATPSFNGLPILSQHALVTADNWRPNEVLGTTGSKSRYEHPHVRNSVTIWEKNAIAAIEDGSRRALSAGYHFTPIMRRGEFEGVSYDGEMRRIIGNHIVLLARSRIGPDVVIGGDGFVHHHAAAQTAAYL